MGVSENMGYLISQENPRAEGVDELASNSQTSR